MSKFKLFGCFLLSLIILSGCGKKEYLNADKPTGNNANLTAYKNERLYQIINNEAGQYIVTQFPKNGNVVLSSTGSMTYVPNPNFWGADSFKYKIQKGSKLSDEFEVKIDVLDKVTNPTVTNFNLSTLEDTLLKSQLTGTSSNSGVLSFQLVEKPQHGTIVLLPNGEFTYIPNLNFNGLDYFTVVANEKGISSREAVVYINVVPVDDIPLANVLSWIIDENQILTNQLTAIDLDSFLLNYILITPPQHGVLVLNTSGFFVYTPFLNYNGSDSFVFKVNDGSNDSLPQIASITVRNVNSAPVISSLINLLSDEGLPLNIPFTITDLDSALDCETSVSLTTSNSSLFDQNSFSLSGTAPNCILNIHPKLNTFGLSDLTLTVSDGELSDSTTFSLNLNQINDAPVLSSILDQVTNEDIPLAIPFTITDIDNDLDCQTSMIASSDNSTLLSLANVVFSGTAPNCIATVTPLLNQNGEVSITLTVSDTGTPVKSDSKTFKINVDAINNAPVIGTIANQVLNEDLSLVVPFSITDVDSTLSCTNSVSLVSNNLSLVPNVVFSGTAPNCQALIAPLLNQAGLVNLTFTVTDGDLTDSKTFGLTVNPVNDAPVISVISNLLGSEGHSSIVNFTITDVDSTLNCSTSMVASSSNQLLLKNNKVVFGGTAPNCTATLTPEALINGLTNLTFTVTDGQLTSSAIFSLSLDAINDPPVISSIDDTAINEDSSVSLNFTISDPDSLLLCSLTNVAVTSSNGSLIPTSRITVSGLAPNCTLTLNPVANANGSSNITVTVHDNEFPDLMDSSSFVLTVNPVNDAPVLATISNQSTNEDTSKNVSFTISDIDSTLNCSTSISGTSSNTSLVSNSNIVFSGTAPNCVVSLTPEANANGTTTLTLVLSDSLLTDTKTFTLTVNPTNDAPILSTIADQSTNEDTAKVVSFSITDIDSTLSCSTSMSASSNNTSLVASGNIVFGGTAPNCTATITPKADATGLVNLTFTVTDGSLTDVKTFAFTVSGVNDSPTLAEISNQSTNEDTSLNVNLVASDIDSTLSCSTSLTSNVSNTGLVSLSNITFTGTIPNCVMTIVPNTNQSGTLSIVVRVSDGTLYQDQTFSLTVNPVNDAPVLSSISTQTTSEDVSKDVSFTITDVDSTLSCSTSVSVVSSNTALVTSGGVVFSGTAPNCIATITPVQYANGTTNLSFTVTDGSLTDVKTFAFNVTSVNNAPVLATITSQTTNEDTAKAVSFTITDVDSTLNCSTSMSVTSSNTALVTSGGVVFSGTAPNCTATVTPVANANGTTNLTLTVTDGSLTDSKTFDLTVSAVNDAPVLATISNQTTSEDVAKAVSFTITDIDSTLSCSTSISVTSSNTSLVTSGGVVFSGTAPNCTATITPVQYANGTTNLTLTVTDGSLTDSKTFALTISAVNNAPVMSSISNQTTSEDVSKAVSFTITDIDSTLNCSTSVSVSSSNTALVTSGSVVFSGTAPNCTATITPVADANGSANLTLTVTDGSLTDTKTFSLTVSAVNDTPVIGAVTNQTTNEDTAKAVSFTITDVDSTLNCSTSMSKASTNTSLLPVANIVFSGTAPNCTVTMTPVADANGVTTVGLTVSDGSLSALRTFTLTVTAVNDNPVFTNSTTLSLATAQNTNVTTNVSSSDVDGDTVTYSITSQGTKGTASVNAAGLVTYVPNSNTSGSDSFQVGCSDGNGGTCQVKTTVSVVINVAPTTTNLSLSTPKNTQLDSQLTSTYTVGNTVTYYAVTQPTNGYLTLNTNGSFSYVPYNNYTGSDSFTFRIHDGYSYSNTSTVNITVLNWLNGWTYRSKITYTSPATTTQTNIPLLVKVNSSNINYASMKSDGTDIRFVDSNHQLLDYEIDTWNTSGDSSIWVKIPSLPSSSSTVSIWMYYGNSSANDAQNKNGVWSNGYVGVWHFNETSGSVLDSTSNGNNGTVVGTLNRTTSGVVGRSFTNSGSNGACVRINHNSSHILDTNLTVESWVYRTSNNAWRYILDKKVTVSSNTYNAYAFGDDSSKLFAEVTDSSDVSPGSSTTSSNQISNNTWTNVAVTYKGSFSSSSKQAVFYKNGSVAQTFSNLGDSLFSGNDYWQNLNLMGDCSSAAFIGTVDEIRLSNVIRSADWMLVQHNSLLNNLSSFGSQQTVSTASE